MIGRLIGLLVTFAITAILLTMAVINRHDVRLVINPADQSDVRDVPVFLLIVAALITGVVLGGVAGWLNQGKWRRTARQRTQEAMRWKAEAERLTRERDERLATAAPPRQLLAG
ncbi:MAG: LapA family protein [Hyphomicrobiaceae bacterium]